MTEYGYKELINLLVRTDGIKCAHLNVNGLLSKLEEVRLLLNEKKIDIREELNQRFKAFNEAISTDKGSIE